MKKMAKVEKMQRKENQTETFETMDESFVELSKLLSFRDKEAERIHKREARAKGVLSLEEKEMDDWEKEMKTYLFERKVKATDRTKTPEEIAKAKADELHAMESKRLARMAGDFLSDDEFSDVSDDEDGGKGGKKRKRRSGDKGKSTKSKKSLKDYSNPEEMDDDNDENEGNEKKRGVRFTADGLMYVDEHDNVIGKVGEDDDNDEDGDKEEDDDDEESDEESDDGSSDDESVHHDLGDSDDEASAATADSDEEVHDCNDLSEFNEGMTIQGNYHADEQYGKKATWYDGTITAVCKNKDGKVLYNVTYDDGDFEEGMLAENIRPRPKSNEDKSVEKSTMTEAEIEKKKKLKAKLRAK
jgi:nucleolar protein 14